MNVFIMNLEGRRITFLIAVHVVMCSLTGKGGKEEDFEIHKKEDSVQKKRHYRNNNKDNDSSGSDSDAEHTRRVSLLYIIQMDGAICYIMKFKLFCFSSLVITGLCLGDAWSFDILKELVRI